MGDVFKAYFVSLHTERKTEAVATVALDRLIGLGTLLAVASIITIFSPSGSRLAELRPYTLGLLGSLPRLDQKGEKLFSIEGTPPDLRREPVGCPFAPRCIYRIDKCAENPPLVTVDSGAPGHIVACWVDVRSGEPIPEAKAEGELTQ